MAGMQTWAKGVLSNFDEYRFYLSEHMSPEGMVILQGYREDQTTPYFASFDYIFTVFFSGNFHSLCGSHFGLCSFECE